MLRSLAIVLVLANMAYMAWTHGWLYQVGLLPAPWPLTEPGRVAQQLRAESISLHHETPTPVASASTPAQAEPAPPLVAAEPSAVDTASPSTPPAAVEQPGTAAAAAVATRCMQLGGTLNERQFASLRTAMSGALPDSAWTVSTSVQPARWIVYSGKFASADALAARKVELKLMQVEFRDVSTANLQPGLAMGTYSTEASAQQALRDVTKAGVKGAKVVAERPEATLYTVKLPDATNALQTRIQRLMDGMPSDVLKGKTLQPCA